MSATSMVFGLANDIVLLDVTRFVQGVGGACSWAAGMAWLVSASPPERRGELIGSSLAAAIVGMLFGPVLGGAATVIGPEALFAGVAVVGAGLASWAWSMPGVPPAEESSVLRAAAALRRPAVAAGFWLFLLPALFSGVLEVLAPLRLDELGASGVAVGAVFLVAAGVEAADQPGERQAVGPAGAHGADPRGPGRRRADGAAAAAPDTAVVMAMAVVAVVAALGTLWAPAMAMLSEASEGAGLDQGLAFALANLAWAGGHVLGGSGGASLADLASDALPYARHGRALRRHPSGGPAHPPQRRRCASAPARSGPARRRAARRCPRAGSPTAAPWSPSSASRSSVVSGALRCSAPSSEAVTACSISAPLKPSLASSSRGMSKPAGSWRRSRRWMPKICSRSAASGRSTKKISSKRPLRSSSGGSSDRSLAVATTNTGSVFSCSQVRNEPNRRRDSPPSESPPPPGRDGLLELVDPEDRRRARLGDRDRPPEVLLGLPDVLVEEPPRVELEQRQLPLARDHLGRQRLAAALHPHQQQPLRRLEAELARPPG